MTTTMTPTKAEQRLRKLVVGWGLVLIGMTIGYIGWTLPNAWTGWTLWAVAGTLATISAAVVYLAHVTRSIARSGGDPAVGVAGHRHRGGIVGIRPVTARPPDDPRSRGTFCDTLDA